MASSRSSSPVKTTDAQNAQRICQLQEGFNAQLAMMQEYQAVLQQEVQRQSAEAALTNCEDELEERLRQLNLHSSNLTGYIGNMTAELSPRKSGSRTAGTTAHTPTNGQGQGSSHSRPHAAQTPPSSPTRARALPTPSKDSGHYNAYVVYMGANGRHGVFSRWFASKNQPAAKPLVKRRDGTTIEGVIYKGFGDPSLARQYYQSYVDTGVLALLQSPPSDPEYFIVTAGVSPGVYTRETLVQFGLGWTGGIVERVEIPKWEAQAIFNKKKDRGEIEFYDAPEGPL